MISFGSPIPREFMSAATASGREVYAGGAGLLHVSDAAMVTLEVGSTLGPPG